MHRWTAAEWAIYAAVQIVECVGADVRLTDAVCLLQEAKDRVADYVDGVKPESVYQARADKLAAARAEGAAEEREAFVEQLRRVTAERDRHKRTAEFLTELVNEMCSNGRAALGGPEGP